METIFLSPSRNETKTSAQTFGFFPKTRRRECVAENKQINNFSLFHTAHEWSAAVQTNTDVDDDKASRSFVVRTDMNEESE